MREDSDTDPAKRPVAAPANEPSTLPQVYLARHGETAWTISGQHTGRTDLPLTARGERNARSLAKRLKGIAFDRVLSSPYQRARRTCELAGFGAAATESDLAEWDYGEYEGRTTHEIRRERPDWDLFRDGCPGGESPEQVAARADRLIARLRELTAAPPGDQFELGRRMEPGGRVEPGGLIEAGGLVEPGGIEPGGHVDPGGRVEPGGHVDPDGLVDLGGGHTEPGIRILLFGHGHFFRALAARWITLPVYEAHHLVLSTAALSIIGYEHSIAEPAILLWNDCRHVRVRRAGPTVRLRRK